MATTAQRQRCGWFRCVCVACEASTSRQLMHVRRVEGQSRLRRACVGCDVSALVAVGADSPLIDGCDGGWSRSARAMGRRRRTPPKDHTRDRARAGAGAGANPNCQGRSSPRVLEHQPYPVAYDTNVGLANGMARSGQTPVLYRKAVL